MFQNGTIHIVFATGVSLLVGFLACLLKFSAGWLTVVDWAGFYGPLCVLTAGAEARWEQRGFI
jgi:hypothetical protein